MKKNTAIILAGGKGKRMGMDIPKQYIEVLGKPILAYTLEVFQSAQEIDEIILVTGKDEIDYCKENIVEKFNIGKVKKIVSGGKERYDSVYEGLKEIKDTGYVFIHDGARPLVDCETISRAAQCAAASRACIVGVKVKDTIKRASAADYAIETINRNELWQIQTPQVFEFTLIQEAYEKALKGDASNITDDAMIIESNTSVPVKLVEGSYENIKITTSVDIVFMEAIIRARQKNYKDKM